MDDRQGNKRAPLSVFISYAHEDELLRQQLEAHLSLLRRQGLVASWHDRQIMPGADWSQEIDEHLETAPIILLLISPDFLASDYCYDIEMQRALERHRRGEASVIPIIVRPVDWSDAPFAQLHCLPRDGEPVTKWDNRDEAFQDIAQGIRRVIEQRTSSAHPAPRFSPIDQQNRLRLLKRVRTIWIEGALEHSLHQASLIALDLREQPDALANPWRLEVQETDLPPRPLPVGTSIVQAYDEADGELLLLGEPGAGKTTLLLELARTLLERTEADKHERLPIVFNLSSWAEQRLPLSDWLIEELWTKYQVPRTIGNAWIAADQILPLLDGLDEVAEDVRSDCVQAINNYHQDRLERGPALLVVCCRSEDYMVLPTRINLRRAVSIQPLTEEQVERYFQSAKGQLEGLRQALHNDPELYELVRRPLMLSIFTLAYGGAARADLPMEGTREVQQRQVFATYVERMLTRRGIPRQASQQQTLRWLTFLAVGMQQHHQTVFYLEHLQADWLGERSRRLLYRLTVGLFVGLFAGLVYELSGVVYQLIAAPFILLLFFRPSFDPGSLLSAWSSWLASTLVVGLSGLVAGLSSGLIYELGQIQPREMLTRSWRRTKRSIVVGLSVGLFVGLFAWQVYRLVRELVYGLSSGLIYGLSSGLASALVVGLVAGLVGGLVYGLGQIQPREMLTRSWRGTKRSIVVGLSVGLFVGLFTALIVAVAGLIVGLVAGLVAGLVTGFSTSQLDDRLRLTPNQGIWRSARNGLIVGLVAGLIVGLAAGLIVGLVAQFGPEGAVSLGTMLFVGQSVGLITTLVTILSFGLGAFFQHFALRFWLWRANGLPRNMVAFLDEAAERILLRRVGGGYIFIHRLLLDYFASLKKKES